MIDAMQITHYGRPNERASDQTILSPTWGMIESEVRTMHRYSKPIVFLLQNRAWPDSDLLGVNGGEDTYHIQVLEKDRWYVAVDPHGSSEEVEVWTSDQGCGAARRYVWDTEKALEIIRWYFEHNERHPEFCWE